MLYIWSSNFIHFIAKNWAGVSSKAKTRVQIQNLTQSLTKDVIFLKLSSFICETETNDSISRAY